MTGIGHHQVGRRLGHRPQRGGPVASIKNLMPSPFEDPPEQEPMGRFVVNDQYLAQLSAVPFHGQLLSVSNPTP
jgi:hypothetical protein